ncbi:MAG: bifunctional rhamnulose-1-phosphate aldolase/short-chain dehydrogenase, partial [Planctomycetota bacterium]
MSTAEKRYAHVTYAWDAKRAANLNGLQTLVYRSNLLGDDGRITNTGGGNTSSKLVETDPLTGEQVEVLWVKGSGGDLRTSNAENFSSLYMSKLVDLQKIYLTATPRGA